MLIYEFSNWLDAYLNIDLFKDFCPNGIQVEGNKEVKKIATAVSANLRTIEEAVEKKVDLLIVHHGIFWNKDPYPIVGTKKRKVELLLKHEISLLAYHLPLDAHQKIGNNWKAAYELKWEELETFGEIGVKARFSTQPIEQFIERLETFYAHKAAVALGGKKQVASVALISGGAYRELPKAAKEGVDCFITGNFDEPAWAMAHEEGIHFLALGHSATERIGPKALAETIQQELKLECFFIDVENPF